MINIGIIGYGMGNLSSVFNALSSVGANPSILHNPEMISRTSHIVLPGVGAFPDAMQLLKSNGWIEPMIEHVILKRKPFLGICLGMQLLAEVGTEHGKCPGLGWIKGTVTKLKDDCVRIPHIGWNDVRFTRDSMLFTSLENGSDFYFVHSYALRPTNTECVTAWCTHGEDFVASLEQDNIFATQFHPEKSQTKGLQVLRNFISC